MIRKLRLSNWRAYESAVIPFDDGTTFIVAPNGIGKTSLLEAARFALTGQWMDLETPVRLGADLAEVELTVQLPLAQVLRIERSLYADPGKQPTFAAFDGDDEISEMDFKSRVAQGWGASTDFAAANAFLTDRLRDLPGLDLRDLLARAFGLEDKRKDAQQLSEMLGPLEGEATQLSKQIRAEQRSLAKLAADRDAAQAAAVDAAARLKAGRAALDAAATTRDLVAAHAAATARQSEWDDAFSEIAEAATAVLGSVEPALVGQSLDAAAQAADLAATDAERRIAILDSRIAMIRAALEELSGADVDCPVCRRPLDEHDKATAEAEHQDELGRLQVELDAVNLDAATRRAGDLRLLVRRVDRIGDRPELPAKPELVDGVDEAYLSARSGLERAVSEHDAAVALAAELEAAVTAAGEAEERTAESIKAWRKWALTSTAATALSRAIDDALNSGLDPIADDVRQRWNSLFADRPGLAFDVDGSLWREIDGLRLDVKAFSAGEKTAARLLMQLAILTTATQIKFCWVDEPLEHLDPQTRRLVAGMLSGGREALGLRQMVVTTYEEQLAANLAAADQSGMTRVEYIRAGQATAGAEL